MFQVVLQYLPLTVEEINTCLTRLYADWDNRYNWLQANPEHHLYTAKSPIHSLNVDVIREPCGGFTSMAFTIQEATEHENNSYILKVLLND